MGAYKKYTENRNVCKCTNCGKDKMLVLSSILFGYLCQDCYYIKDSKIRIITAPQEYMMFNSPYSPSLIPALIDLHSRYVSKMVSADIKPNKTILKFKIRYRNSECDVDMMTTEEVVKLPKVAEMVLPVTYYTISKGNKKIAVRKFTSYKGERYIYSE